MARVSGIVGSAGQIHWLKAIMLNCLHQWLSSLNETERNLRSQGYLVVYGGMSSFIVPVGSDDMAPHRPGKPLLFWGAAPAAFGL